MGKYQRKGLLEINKLVIRLLSRYYLISRRCFSCWPLLRRQEEWLSCSVFESCLTLCDPHGLQHTRLPSQAHVHWVGDAIQPSHPLSSPSPLALSLSQHQSLSKWFSYSYQVAKALELQLQHQSFQWIFRVDFLLALTGLISLLSKWLSRVVSTTTVQKRNFFE